MLHKSGSRANVKLCECSTQLNLKITIYPTERIYEFDETKPHVRKIQICDSVSIRVDIARVYGQDWADAMSADPVSVFLADGSRVGVTRPQKFTV